MTRQVFILLILLATAFTTGLAQKPASPAEKYFTDVELINQDGKKVRFYSDVLKGKTVIVNAFFTSCTSVCPPTELVQVVESVVNDKGATK